MNQKEAARRGRPFLRRANNWAALYVNSKQLPQTEFHSGRSNDEPDVGQSKRCSVNKFRKQEMFRQGDCCNEKVKVLGFSF